MIFFPHEKKIKYQVPVNRRVRAGKILPLTIYSEYP